MENSLKEEFDEVVHNSELFDILDKPHKVEDSIPTAMTKSQVREYINSMRTPTEEEVEQSYIKQSAAPDYSSEPENYKKE